MDERVLHVGWVVRRRLPRLERVGVSSATVARDQDRHTVAVSASSMKWVGITVTPFARQPVDVRQNSRRVTGSTPRSARQNSTGGRCISAQPAQARRARAQRSRARRKARERSKSRSFRRSLARVLRSGRYAGGKLSSGAPRAGRRARTSAHVAEPSFGAGARADPCPHCASPRGGFRAPRHLNETVDLPRRSASSRSLPFAPRSSRRRCGAIAKRWVRLRQETATSESISTGAVARPVRGAAGAAAPDL